MSKCYGIKLKSNEMIYYSSEFEVKVGDLVVVDTDRGLQLSKIEVINDDLKEDLKSIVRIATKDDYNKYLKNLKDADIAFKKAVKYAKELNLDMSIISAQYNLDRSQLLFNFTSDERVDFRELAKKLASNYHTRIELRQIGARDKAKEIGGLGICGAVVCCQRFMRKMNTISMSMAKNQNLALNPNKINGSCGRLLCCLAHEDEIYVESAQGLPSVGDKFMMQKGEGVVIGVDILKRRVKVLINGEKEFYDIESSKE